jgi:hypothetical protein
MTARAPLDVPIVNHVFLTPRFFVKGTVRTGELRLSSFLNSARRPLLQVDSVTFVDFELGDRIVARRATLRLADVLLAYEFLDLAGDPLRKKLSQPEQQDYRMVSAYFRPPSRLEVLGRVRQELLEATPGDDFFVVMEPLLRGFPDQPVAELDMLKNLPYAIVNRAQLHCFFEYE